MTDPYREPDPPKPRWTDAELDEIAGIGEAQLKAAMEQGAVRSIRVTALARRMAMRFAEALGILPPPVFPTACNHKFGRIFGRDKCRHCGLTKKEIEVRHAQSL